MKQILIVIALLITSQISYSQNKVTWKRSDETSKIDLNLFRSTQAINLPTAETMQKGDFEFEISHRFIPTIKSGSKSFWGFDGPANIRFALGYAVTDRAVITLGRSNINDNYDLLIRYKTFQYRDDLIPILLGLSAGIAWNTEVAGRSASDSKNFQYLGQIIINTIILKKIGIGVVPTYLYNSHILCSDTEYSFTMGTYIQYYFIPRWSFIIEWNPTVAGFRQKYNSVSMGIELETGGHFFKIIMSNSSRLNTSQFIMGADDSFNDGRLRFGFNITRVL